MSMKTFLAMTGHGLTRASQGEGGEWTLEALLPDQDVRCLAADPLNRPCLEPGSAGPVH